MRSPLSALFLSAMIASAQRPVTKAVAAKPPAEVAEHQTSLPVTRVSLYKNGVGFFEHTGNITGNAAVTIDFTSGQLNDVLQSLTAIDLNGGRIAGADYNSTTPLDQQLKNLPLALTANPTITDFYSSIRGSRVEVRTGAASMIGRLLAIEVGDSVGTHVSNGTDTSDSPQKLFLTIVSDAGDVHTVMVTTTTNVRLLDPSLDLSLTKYLQLLDANRSQGLRHLTLTDNGTGTRELHLSYISEVPIWKSTYRILFTDAAKSASSSQTATLQGWSVIDNTTGTDWLNVRLSLIAGSPQSFIQPLSQPIYFHRPEIAIAQEAQLTPQTFESGELRGASGSGLAGTITDPTGAAVPSSTVVATNTATGARETRTTDGSGRFNMVLAAGNYTVEVSKPGFQRLIEQGVNVNGQQIATLTLRLPVGSESTTVEVTASNADLQTMNASTGTTLDPKARSVPNRYVAGGMGGRIAAPPPPPPAPSSYEDIAANSFASNTQSNAFDDFFAYNVSEPVTIHKNESALVPILQAKVAAERVTLIHSDGSSISQPVRALWLTNTSGLTLDRGSFSIVENGAFGGEGLLDPIHPDEKRLLSYAADQAVHVSTESDSGTNHIEHISIAKGVLVIRRAEQAHVTYVIRNAATDARTVVLEHPIKPGYNLDNSAKPDETTPTVYRFRIQAPAGQTVRFPITANHTGFTTYQLTNSDENQLAFFIQQSGNNLKLTAALAPILEARRHVAEAEAAKDKTDTLLDNLHANEDRERANIVALATADKTARDRFVHDLNATEDQIISTQKELDSRTAALDAAKADLSNRIESLQIDDTM
jgi:hypothetical protein